MNYEPKEKLVTVEPIGSKRKGNLIPIGTEVEFVKVQDSADMANTLIAFKYDSRVIVTKETNVKPINKKKVKKAFTEFDKQMMLNNPRLRRHHPNIIMRYFYRVYYYIKDRRSKWWNLK